MIIIEGAVRVFKKLWRLGQMSEEKRKQGDKTPESQRRQALVESMQRAKQEFL